MFAFRRESITGRAIDGFLKNVLTHDRVWPHLPHWAKVQGVRMRLWIQ